MPKAITFLIIFFLTATCLFAESGSDLVLLTRDCIKAAKEYREIQKDFPYKMLHTVEYKGWSGNDGMFELANPISMTIRYAGLSKKGYYWFADAPNEKFKIVVKSDLAGNFSMVRDDNGSAGYTFRGTMKEGLIKGVWKNKNGETVFAFYAKAILK